uniref:Uncharacterized protein n=1 Tax=Meloidogyne enterolobii TaxID=390850 RepID=A0A6V7UFF0_MELEN|nr:unnamed protein product [Meloidogyne enterolobii]
MKLFVLLIGVLAFSVLNVHGDQTSSSLTRRNSRSDSTAEKFTDVPLGDNSSWTHQAVSDIEMPGQRKVQRREAPMSIGKKVVAVIFLFLLSFTSFYLLAVPKQQIQQVEYKQFPQPYKFVPISNIVKCDRKTKECSVKLENLDPTNNYSLYTAKNDKGRGDKVKLTKVADIDLDKCQLDKNAKPEVNGEEICKQIVKGIDDNAKADTIEVNSDEIEFGSELEGTEDYAIVEEAINEKKENRKQEGFEHVHMVGPGEQPLEHNQPTIEYPTNSKQVHPVNEYQHKLEERVKKLGLSDFKHGDLYEDYRQQKTVQEDEKAKRYQKLLGTLEDPKHPSLVDQYRRDKGNFNQRVKSDDTSNKDGKAKNSDSNGLEQKLEKLALSDFKHGDLYKKYQQQITVRDDEKAKRYLKVLGTLGDHKHPSLVDQYDKDKGKFNQRAKSDPTGNWHEDLFGKDYQRAMSDFDHLKAKQREKILGTLEDHKHPSLIDQYNKDKGSLNKRAKSDPTGNKVVKAKDSDFNGSEQKLEKLALSDFKHGDLLGRKGGFKQRTIKVPAGKT